MYFLTWIAEHLSLIGWPAIGIFIWKTSSKVKTYTDRFAKSESTIELLATNHLPHIQAELEKMNNGIDIGFTKMADGMSNLSRDLLILLSNKD
jgi:hypothetical protein